MPATTGQHIINFQETVSITDEMFLNDLNKSVNDMFDA
jgi:hypothetical protein